MSESSDLSATKASSDDRTPPEPGAKVRSGASVDLQGTQPAPSDPGRTIDDHMLAAAAPRHRGAAGCPSIPGYEIVRELGRGGMGVVYHAWQQFPKRQVALKLVLAGPQAGGAQRTRFRKEIEAVASLQHHGIAQVYQVGEHEERPFFSLEYVEGGSLDHKLSGTPLPARQAAELLEQAARAIYFTHQQGIVHRDLKPANILLTANGQPKVTDFGLAKQMDGDQAQAQTQSGVLLGTPSYMAPEQAAGQISLIGPATDIYGLGAVLYEMLTGRPPFKAANLADTLEQVRSVEPVPPARLNPRVPRDLETICLKCLEKLPGRRYTSAAAVADDLRRFLAGTPIVARPIGLVERGWRWCMRNRLVASLVFTLCSLFVGGTSATTYFALQAKAEAEARALQAKAEAEARSKVLVRFIWFLQSHPQYREMDARSLVRKFKESSPDLTLPETVDMDRLVIGGMMLGD